jgi:hypothetical protein
MDFMSAQGTLDYIHQTLDFTSEKFISIMLCFSRSAPAHGEIAGWNATRLNLLWEIWYLWQSIGASCCWCYAWQVQIAGLSVLWKGIFASEKCSVVPLLFSFCPHQSTGWITKMDHVLFCQSVLVEFSLQSCRYISESSNIVVGSVNNFSGRVVGHIVLPWWFTAVMHAAGGA